MRLVLALVLVSATVACSKQETWIDKPMSLHRDQAGDTEFTWMVPDALQRSGLGWRVQLRPAKGHGPILAVQRERGMPSSLAHAVQKAKTGELIIFKKEAIGGGYLVVAQTDRGDYVLVNSWRPAKAGSLHCQASRTWSEPHQLFAATRDWLEAVCRSMRTAGTEDEDDEDADAADDE